MTAYTSQLKFFTEDFAALVATLDAPATGKWGKMNAQQMAEHVANVFAASCGKINLTIQTPPEYLAKAKAFLLSDKEFRENTKAPASFVPEEPQPAKHSSMNSSVEMLQAEINNFITYFQQNPKATTIHPAFGELNFDEWVLAHYKHTLHHAKQFGLVG